MEATSSTPEIPSIRGEKFEQAKKILRRENLPYRVNEVADKTFEISVAPLTSPIYSEEEYRDMGRRDGGLGALIITQSIGPILIAAWDLTAMALFTIPCLIVASAIKLIAMASFSNTTEKKPYEPYFTVDHKLDDVKEGANNNELKFVEGIWSSLIDDNFSSKDQLAEFFNEARLEYNKDKKWISPAFYEFMDKFIQKNKELANSDEIKEIKELGKQLKITKDRIDELNNNKIDVKEGEVEKKIIEKRDDIEKEIPEQEQKYNNLLSTYQTKIIANKENCLKIIKPYVQDFMKIQGKFYTEELQRKVSKKQDKIKYGKNIAERKETYLETKEAKYTEQTNHPHKKLKAAHFIKAINLEKNKKLTENL